MEFTTSIQVTHTSGIQTLYLPARNLWQYSLHNGYPIQVLKYPYKWDSNIVSTSIKPIVGTITQWNSLTVFQEAIQVGIKHCIYKHKICSSNHLKTWNPLTVLNVPIDLEFKHCIQKHKVCSKNHYTTESITSNTNTHTNGIQTLYLPA